MCAQLYDCVFIIYLHASEKKLTSYSSKQETSGSLKKFMEKLWSLEQKVWWILKNYDFFFKFRIFTIYKTSFW